MTKTIKIIFTLSVLLNLIMFGVLGGGLYKRFEPMGVMKELSPQGRVVAQKYRKEARKNMHSEFKAMRVQRKELQKIITAPEFDKNAYGDAIDKLLTGRDKIARQKASSVAQVLSELSVEERQKMSKRILRSLSRNGGKKGHLKKNPLRERGQENNR